MDRPSKQPGIIVEDHSDNIPLSHDSEVNALLDETDAPDAFVDEKFENTTKRLFNKFENLLEKVRGKADDLEKTMAFFVAHAANNPSTDHLPHPSKENEDNMLDAIMIYKRLCEFIALNPDRKYFQEARLQLGNLMKSSEEVRFMSAKLTDIWAETMKNKTPKA